VLGAWALLSIWKARTGSAETRRKDIIFAS